MREEIDKATGIDSNNDLKALAMLDIDGGNELSEKEC